MENYFNYFTEIEDCFRRCRGTPTLLSTLDWALIESWKESGIPLEAVLLGIERAFEKFHARPRRFQKVNSLAYCTQEVLRAAEDARAAARGGETEVGLGEAKKPPEPFPAGEVLAFLNHNAGQLEQASRKATENNQAVVADDLAVSAATIRNIAGGGAAVARDLEELENQLSALEEKISASLTRASSVDLLAQFRREVERGIAPYRRKMSAAQIESLERQFLKKRLFEHYEVPRLSLFYL